MASRTNLNILDLPNIFQSLADNRRTGTLRVKSGTQEKLVYFENGNIKAVHTPLKATMLGEALIRTKVIDEQTLQEAIGVQDEKGGRLGETLLEMGKIEKKDLLKALTFQVTEEVCELFTWEDIFCEFISGKPQAGTFELDELTRQISLAAPPLLMEAARRIDEWEHIKRKLPSMKDVLVLKKKPDATFRGTIKAELLKWVDGVRDLEEILDRARMSRFNALKTMKILIDEGFLRTRTSRELVEAAKIVQQKGRGGRESGISKIIKLYERAEELGINNPKLSLWLAKAYERLKKQKESVTRYKTLGKVSLDKGNLEDAVSHYAKIVSLNADDLDSHTQLLETLIKLGRDDEAAKQGASLLQKYRLSGRAEEAVPIAQSLEPLAEGRGKLSATLAETFLDAGDRIQALILYETLAEFHENKQDYEEAILTYERMLEIDNENIDAHYRLANALTQVGRTGDAVKRYKTLADMLTSSGVLENSINWQFLINVYEHLVAIEPGNILAREWLADAYISKKDEKKAADNLKALHPHLKDKPAKNRVRPLRKLVDLVPDDFDARLDLGTALEETGDTDEAIGEFAEMGNIALTNGNLDIARTAFEKALNLDPFDASTCEGLGKVNLRSGRAHEAAQAFRDAAVLLRLQGKLERALPLLKTAVETDPERIETLLDSAAIYKKRGDLPQAQAVYRDYIQRSMNRRNFGEAKRTLTLLLALNQNDEWARGMLARLQAAEKENPNLSTTS